MKKATFVAVMLVAALACGVVFSSCASMTPANNFLSFSRANDSLEKTGTATSKVWLGVFGEINFPTIETAAKNGGITKITAVQYYVKPGILNLWADYYTIVYGE
jgi:hypothetical protein